MEVPKLSVFSFVFVCLLVWGFINRIVSEEYVFATGAADGCGLKSKLLNRIKYRHQV